jgi:quercetin dioxygenase-like cupin family protein
MSSEASGNVSEMLARRKKGQRSVTWDEPGEWTQVPDKKLSYAWVPIGEDEGGAAGRVMVVKYEPGAYVAPHYHHADYCSVVVEGSIEVTRRTHGVGSIRVVNAGTAYGPLIAGPEGCTVIEFFVTGVPDPSLSPMNTYV